MDQTIHLLVPGLFGPQPMAKDVAPEQRWPCIEKHLHWASRDKVSGADYESTLLGLFDLAELATAPLRRLADGADADARYWLQLNPIFLRPDQDRLLVFSSADLNFSLEESKELATAFSLHFSDEGWDLEVANAHRWYLSLPEKLNFSVAEFSQVLGRNMDPFLPTGDDSAKWHGILNEIQMLFFNHPLNEGRESRGLAPINGLWLSGGGELPREKESPYNWLIGDDALACGLAKYNNLRRVVLDGMNDFPFEHASGILVYDYIQESVHHADPYRWIEAVSGFDQWLESLLQTLPSAAWKVNLYPCDGRRLTLQQKSGWKFWQRPKGLLTQLARNRFPLD